MPSKRHVEATLERVSYHGDGMALLKLALCLSIGSADAWQSFYLLSLLIIDLEGLVDGIWTPSGSGC